MSKRRHPGNQHTSGKKGGAILRGGVLALGRAVTESLKRNKLYRTRAEAKRAWNGKKDRSPTS